MVEEELTNVDKLILQHLKSSKTPRTTYELAKDLEISWATVNLHCNKLFWMKQIKKEIKVSKTGMKKVYWSVR